MSTSNIECSTLQCPLWVPGFLRAGLGSVGVGFLLETVAGIWRPRGPTDDHSLLDGLARLVRISTLNVGR